MPSSTEHDAPLSLIGGTDVTLIWLARGMAVVTTGLIATGGLSLNFKILLVLSAVISWSITEHRARAASGQSLRIYPGGQTTCNGTLGYIRDRAWVSRRYVVVELQEATVRTVVISASRQCAGEYRRLLVWLRYQRWRGDR